MELTLIDKFGRKPKLLKYVDSQNGCTYQLYKVKIANIREARYANNPFAWMLLKDVPLEPAR
jgi:hypothetical protein